MRAGHGPTVPALTPRPVTVPVTAPVTVPTAFINYRCSERSKVHSPPQNMNDNQNPKPKTAVRKAAFRVEPSTPIPSPESP